MQTRFFKNQLKILHYVYPLALQLQLIAYTSFHEWWTLHVHLANVNKFNKWKNLIIQSSYMKEYSMNKTCGDHRIILYTGIFVPLTCFSFRRIIHCKYLDLLVSRQFPWLYLHPASPGPASDTQFSASLHHSLLI